MKVKEIIRISKEDSWYQARQRSIQRQFKHPAKPVLVTIAGKPWDDIAPRDINSILKQARLKDGQEKMYYNH